MLRVISGVIIGYFVFGLSGFLLFRVTHQDPHAPASITFEICSIVYGVMFALVAGYVASFIGGRPNIIAARIVAGIVALVAIVTMILSGISWSPMMALLLMAPATWLGGWLYRQRTVASEGSENQE